MEKTGATQKKVYDFNTAAFLEVCIKGIWYSTTANHFRSFDGNRRITQTTTIPSIGESFSDLIFETKDYEGPVYVLQTNLEVPKANTQTLITIPHSKPTVKSIQISNRI